MTRRRTTLEEGRQSRKPSASYFGGDLDSLLIVSGDDLSGSSGGPLLRGDLVLMSCLFLIMSAAAER